MSARITGLAALCVIALQGCGDQTGVIIEITRDEQTTTAEISELQVYVGVASGADNARGYVDSGQASQTIDVGARDLLDDPYRLLLSPGKAKEMGMMVAVVAYAGDQQVAFGQLDQPVGFVDGELVQWSVTLFGDPNGNVEVTDTGCLVWYEADTKIVIGAADDADCDGDLAVDDCDDSNPAIGPSSPELCANDIDDDCDGDKDEVEDGDSDGVVNCDDCDDSDDRRYPGAEEICDGLDNDCNDKCDDGLDGDGDRFTTCGTHLLEDGSCVGPDDNKIDCNDEIAAINPEAEELCDGIDNDCNEICDDEFDPDGDFFTECGSDVRVCEGTNAANIDCEPEDEHAWPGNRPEVCDGVDNDCDGVFYPEVVPCYVEDTSGAEPVCRVGKRMCGDVDGNGWVGDCVADDVDPMVVPAGLCDAYDLCDTDPDPFACANQMVAATSYSCTVAHLPGAGGELCRPAAAALPDASIGGVSCSWYMSPTSIRPAYQATLTAEPFNASPPPASDTLDACDAFFSVLGSNAQPPKPDSYLLLQTETGEDRAIIRLNLTPVEVTQCPVNGLDCTGLVSPVPPG